MTLDSVALFTQSALREMDLLARLDDGEFIVLLPGSTLSEANQIAKRLQTAAANCVIPAAERKVAIARDPRHRANSGRTKPRRLLMARAKAAVEAEVAQKHAVNWPTFSVAS